jgi:hypothetical protein
MFVIIPMTGVHASARSLSTFGEKSACSQAKSALRAAGIKVNLAMTPVHDAEGGLHDTLVWRVAR